MIVPGILLFLSMAMPGGELDDLPILTGGISRISSYDREDGDFDYFNVFSTQTLVLADIRGAGTIKRFYIKVDSDDPDHLRTLLLRFYWDESEEASVDCPLGDFFALGHGKYYTVLSVPIMTGNKRGLSCFFPMPFHRRALITLYNESKGSPCRVYYQIDYTPERPESDVGLFHALYTQGHVAPGSANYQVLHAEGKGKYVGLVLSMTLGEDGWFGNGDERIYVDDVETPTVQGTGLDDLFGCAWGFTEGFCGPYFGSPVMGDLVEGSEFVGYRFYLRAPITFNKSIDVLLEHVGEHYTAGHLLGGSLSRRDSFYSVAYWYQAGKPKPPWSRMPHSMERISGDRRFSVEGEFMRAAEGSVQKVKPVVVYGATVARFTPETVGDKAEFLIHFPKNSKYEVSGYFTRSSRHGTYRLTIGGQVIEEPVDFFKNEGGQGRYYTQRSDLSYLGTVELEGGLWQMTFETLDPNEKAEGMLLGIDSMIFRPIR